MAKYGSDDLAISVGGTAMAGHVDTINGVEISAMEQESHTFGDSWAEHLFTGVKQGEPITVGGFYDDTAVSGPDAKFGGSAVGSEVAVIVTYGGTKTSTFQALIRKYRRLPKRGELHRYEAELVPTGAITEA